MTDVMEGNDGGNQLCKGIPHALIQQKSSELALWYKWPSLISGQKEVSSEMPPCTELDGGHVCLGQEPRGERQQLRDQVTGHGSSLPFPPKLKQLNL